MKFKYYLRGAGAGVIITTVILTIAFLFHRESMSDAEVIQRALELGMIMDESAGTTLADVAKDQENKKVDLDRNAGADDDKQDGADTAVDQLEKTKKSTADKKQSDAEAKTDAAAEKKGESDDKTEAGKKAVSDDEEASDQKAAVGTSDGASVDNTSKSVNMNEKNVGKAENKTAAIDTKDSPSARPASSETSTTALAASDSRYQKGSGTLSEAEDDTGDAADADGSKVVTVEVHSGDVSRIVSERVTKAGLVDDSEEFNRYLGSHGYDKLLHAGTYEIEKGASFQEIAKKLTQR